MNWISLHLLGRMKGGQQPEDVSLYMRMHTSQVDIPIDLMDFFQEPSSYFLIPGKQI